MEDEKLKGPENKVQEGEYDTSVPWNVVDGNGDVKEVYFEANQLKKGFKKECCEFVDRLK